MPRRVPLTYNGKEWTQSALAKSVGMDPRTLNWRLLHGWSLAKALETAIDDREFQPRACRWCDKHERAWLEPIDGPPYWHDLPRGMLWVALRIARGSGCAGQIQVEVSKCDQCRH